MKRVNIRAVKQATGELVELNLKNGLIGGRLLCPQVLIPGPGQYLRAHDDLSDSPLPISIFSAGSVPGGFLIAPSIPQTWQPGIPLSLRGPQGNGFSLPISARRVVLASLGETSARLKPLLIAALEQNALVVLVSDKDQSDLAPEVEIQPVSALAEVAHWADYLALDTPRDNLPSLGEIFGHSEQEKVDFEAQVLVVAPMPCGGMADCGVCSVALHHGWRMACKNGPVFELKELI